MAGIPKEWAKSEPPKYHLQSLSLTGVTILLSLTVFLNTVSETMPVTSDNPLLGKENSISSQQLHSFRATTILVGSVPVPRWIKQ